MLGADGRVCVVVSLSVPVLSLLSGVSSQFGCFSLVLSVPSPGGRRRRCRRLHCLCPVGVVSVVLLFAASVEVMVRSLCITRLLPIQLPGVPKRIRQFNAELSRLLLVEILLAFVCRWLNCICNRLSLVILYLHWSVCS